MIDEMGSTYDERLHQQQRNLITQAAAMSRLSTGNMIDGKAGVLS